MRKSVKKLIDRLQFVVNNSNHGKWSIEPFEFDKVVKSIYIRHNDKSSVYVYIEIAKDQAVNKQWVEKPCFLYGSTGYCQVDPTNTTDEGQAILDYFVMMGQLTNAAKWFVPEYIKEFEEEQRAIDLKAARQ